MAAKKRGRKPSRYQSTAYMLRLSTRHEPEEKKLFDAWIEQTGIPERSVAIAEVIKSLIREVSGLAPRTGFPAGIIPDTINMEQRIAERLRGELRSWLETLLTDDMRFATIQQARAAVQQDTFDPAILENILEDFDGRQDE